MDRTGLMHMGRGERKSKYCERDAGAMTLQIERVATVARTSNGRLTDFGREAHANWMRGRSRILDGERRAERAVGRWFGLCHSGVVAAGTQTNIRASGSEHLRKRMLRVCRQRESACHHTEPR
jgi:hypothetical protein